MLRDRGLLHLVLLFPLSFCPPLIRFSRSDCHPSRLAISATPCPGWKRWRWYWYPPYRTLPARQHLCSCSPSPTGAHCRWATCPICPTPQLPNSKDGCKSFSCCNEWWHSKCFGLPPCWSEVLDSEGPRDQWEMQMVAQLDLCRERSEGRTAWNPLGRIWKISRVDSPRRRQCPASPPLYICQLCSEESGK